MTNVSPAPSDSAIDPSIGPIADPHQRKSRPTGLARSWPHPEAVAGHRATTDRYCHLSREQISAAKSPLDPIGDAF